MLRSYSIGVLVLWLAASILTQTSAAETPFERRFVTQERSDFAAENAVPGILSDIGMISIQSPPGWRLFYEPHHTRNAKRTKIARPSPHGSLDSLLVVFYHPSSDLLCDLSVNIEHPQKYRMTGFGSKHGISLSPAANYEIMQRDLSRIVWIWMRESGRFTHFGTSQTGLTSQPNLVAAAWRYESEDGSLSEGIGTTNLINSTFVLTFCHWPKGQPRGPNGIQRLKELRDSVFLLPLEED